MHALHGAATGVGGVFEAFVPLERLFRAAGDRFPVRDGFDGRWGREEALEHLPVHIVFLRGRSRFLKKSNEEDEPTVYWGFKLLKFVVYFCT